jgi:hypothetical protein
MYVPSSTRYAGLHTLPVEEKYPKKNSKKNLPKFNFLNWLGTFSGICRRATAQMFIDMLLHVCRNTPDIMHIMLPLFPRIKSDQFSSLNP